MYAREPRRNVEDCVAKAAHRGITWITLITTMPGVQKCNDAVLLLMTNKRTDKKLSGRQLTMTFSWLGRDVRVDKHVEGMTPPCQCMRMSFDGNNNIVT